MQGHISPSKGKVESFHLDHGADTPAETSPLGVRISRFHRLVEVATFAS